MRTFYRYFDSKLDVVVARTSDSPTIEDVMQAVVARPPSETPVTALRQVFYQAIVLNRDLDSPDSVGGRQDLVMLTTPSLTALRREHFHRIELGFASAIATRLGRAPDDIDSRLLAAAFIAALELSVDRWLAAGRPRGRLWPTLSEAIDRLDHHFPS